VANGFFSSATAREFTCLSDDSGPLEIFAGRDEREVGEVTAMPPRPISVRARTRVGVSGSPGDEATVFAVFPAGVFVAVTAAVSPATAAGWAPVMVSPPVRSGN
jgi:hypothetical protein